MLKKRELTDCYALFELMIHPDVFPFVRNKAETIEEYMFHVKNMIEEEEQGKLISRTILDEWENPIGCISLYEIEEQKASSAHGSASLTMEKAITSGRKTRFCELFMKSKLKPFYENQKNKYALPQSRGKAPICRQD